MALAVFDIGGTAVKYGIWSDDQIEQQDKFQTPDNWEQMKVELSRIFNALQEKTTEKFSGAAFSCPGAVDSEAGVINGFSAVPYIHNIPIQTELTELLGVPVSIENDANCAALAEVAYGAARDVDNALFIVIGSGIGGAVIINKELIKGKNLFGGEFGFMLLEGDASFSDLASPVRAARLYTEELGLPKGTISGKELFTRAEEGEPIAVRYVENLKNNLARGIHTLLVALNPEKVVIGGAISSRKELIPEVTERIHHLLKKTNATDVEVNVVPCQYNNDANLMGAVVAFDKC